jgi:hypothetical protein
MRYRLALQDLSEMFLQRGVVFSHEAVREWEAKLAPVLTAESGIAVATGAAPDDAPGTWMRRT